jgi:acetyl-CoA/propionyl-CoA carboxylase biotin carboxyl carrier protein
VRWDGAYEEGDALPAEFDSLLGKLVVYGADRIQALARARRALSEFRIDGIATVLPMDRIVVDHPDFVAEPFRVHTRWIETVLADALEALPPFLGHSEPEPREGRRRLLVEVDGRRVEVTLPEALAVFGGPSLPQPPPRRRQERTGTGSGAAGTTVTSPMQAKVVKVVVANGQHVMRGETVIDVEAMKMEQSLNAPSDGWVQGLAVKVGDEVMRGEVLCRVTDTGPEEGAP